MSKVFAIRHGLLYLCKNEFNRHYLGTADSVDLATNTKRAAAVKEANSFFATPGEYQIVEVDKP